MVSEFVQQIKDTVSEQINEIHTAMPGRIVSVDTLVGTCTVMPMIKKKTPNGSLLEYPQISGVPLVLPQGSGQSASVSFPVKSGDGCLLIVSEQALDYWMYGRNTDTDLKFDITNAVCIPGLFKSVPKGFAYACRTDSIIVDAGSVRLTVSPTGVTVDGSLTVNGSITGKNISSKGDITAGGVSLKTHVHTSSEPGDDTGSPK
jgi:hypothetical protein